MPVSTYILLLLITAIVSTVVANYALQRQGVQGARPMAFMMVAITVWSLAYALQLVSVTLPLKIFWERVEYIGILFVPYFWLIFSMQYTKRDHSLTRRSLTLLAIFPILALALVWTNELHGWIWHGASLEPYGALVTVHFDRGLAFWAIVAYCYIFALAGILLVFRFFVNAAGLQRKQAGLILFGASLPWIASLIYLIGIIPSLDLTAFAFALSGFIVIIALVYFGLLEAGSVAYKMVFESLTDGVMVIDNQDRLIDLNPAAAESIGHPISHLIGRRSADVFQEWARKLPAGDAKVFNRFLTESQTHQEISLWEAGRKRTIDLWISPLKGETSPTSGKIVIWRDLTENRQKDETLQRQLDELTLMSQAISLTASSKDITSALQKVCAAAANYFRSPQAAVAVLDQAYTAAEVVAEYCAPGRPSAIGIKIPVAENPSITYILEHKSPLAILNAQTDALLAPVHDVMRQREVASILIVPIMIGDKVIGTLGIDDLTQHVFSQADIALMENIAQQVGQALERLRLFSDANEQASRMARLAEISGNLSHTATVEQVLDGIGQGTLALSAADRVAIFIREPDDMASSPWHQGLSQEYLDQVLLNARELPGGQLFQNSQPVLISDTGSLPDGSLLKRMALAEGYQSIGLWPLIYEERVVAAVGCYYNAPHTWSDAQREVLLTFVRQAAVALQNARLFEETRRRAFQMETLNAIILATAAAPDTPSMLQTVLSLTLRALDLVSGGIWVAGYSAIQGLPVELGKALSTAVRQAGVDVTRTVAVEKWDGIGAGETLEYVAEIMTCAGIQASLAVPVMTEGRRIGEMILTNVSTQQWRDEDVALVESVGRQLGSAVERLNLLAKTQEQARQMRQIMDSVPEGVLLLDSLQNLILLNPAAGPYLADLAGEVGVGDRLTHLADCSVVDLLTPKEEWFEIEATNPTRRFFEVAAQPLSSIEQNEGWVLVLRDVTQERENQTRSQMQERLATVGQLAAGIAHDFNNIMAAIFVYTDLLMMEPGLSSANQERLTTIQKQVQRAASLIRQILDFSRRSVMEHSTLDLLPFIKELDKMLRRVLPETIHLDLVYHPGSYLVNADPARLQQVFMNLALNARDAMPGGGTLRFAMDLYNLTTEQFPPIPELAVGRWVRIEVTDTGLGIPDEVMPHIFEPFFTTKPVGQGTGLGLAQVYGIIKQHGGAIDVFSQPGEGTIFTIYLPALEADNEEYPTGTAMTSEEMGAGEAVLLVEDDEAAREALRTLLEEQNFKALTASNGLEALKLLQSTSEPIALVISDIVMPEMGGIELLHALQTYRPDVKVLLITGHPLDLDNQSVLELGDVHWMQKPFSAQSFNKMVKGLLEKDSIEHA